MVYVYSFALYALAFFYTIHTCALHNMHTLHDLENFSLIGLVLLGSAQVIYHDQLDIGCVYPLPLLPFALLSCFSIKCFNDNNASPLQYRAFTLLFLRLQW